MEDTYFIVDRKILLTEHLVKNLVLWVYLVPQMKPNLFYTDILLFFTSS